MKSIILFVSFYFGVTVIQANNITEIFIETLTKNLNYKATVAAYNFVVPFNSAANNSLTTIQNTWNSISSLNYTSTSISLTSPMINTFVDAAFDSIKVDFSDNEQLNKIWAIFQNAFNQAIQSYANLTDFSLDYRKYDNVF